MKRVVSLGPIILSAVFLFGCNAGSPAAAAAAAAGGGGAVSATGTASATDSAPAGPTTAPADSPTAQQLAQLESDGKLPKLDRSESVAGPDTDGNGVRDDIDAHLLKRFPDKIQRAAAIQMARAMQSAVLAGGSSPEKARAASDNLDKATDCLYQRLQDKEGTNTAGAVGLEIEALTTNTKARLLAYLAYNKSQDGTVSLLAEGDTCE